ncbi:MAG: HAMP domain-containing sensor histidine kinase [Polyangiales bacterium]
MGKTDPASASIVSLLLVRELAQVLDKHGVTLNARLGDLDGQPLTAAAQTALLADLRAGQQKIEHLRRLSSTAVLAAGVTHEIRNLLTGALGFTQLLRQKAHEPASVQDAARTIETELRRCVDVVASFLRLSRSGMEPTRELTVNELVEAVQRLTSHPVRQRGCSLRVLAESELPQVLGRISDLERLFINLVLNAADAAHVPGVEIVLSATLASDGNVELRVSDDGPGIPAAIAERIFEPFFSTKQAGEGTGLGLAISRGIAEAHGGKLTLEEQTTPGATFLLRLPPAGFRLDGRPLPGTRP